MNAPVATDRDQCTTECSELAALVAMTGPLLRALLAKAETPATSTPANRAAAASMRAARLALVDAETWSHDECWARRVHRDRAI